MKEVISLIILTIIFASMLFLLNKIDGFNSTIIMGIAYIMAQNSSSNKQD